MRTTLKVFYVLVLVVMTAVTVVASLDRGVVEAVGELWPDPWFRATLADTYFAFLTIYFWVAYKERSWLARGLWLVAFLALGNFAIAAYLLRELFRLRAGDSFADLLVRRDP
ncbi:MAG: DUF1475 family protein [Acidobacteria bacterium]|nr:DUF1475 family protein [Acidobacteriota bacterium]